MFGKHFVNINLMFLSMLAVAVLLLSSVVKAQQSGEAQNAHKEVSSNRENTDSASTTNLPGTAVFTHFMGVRLGMNANEVREKLGNLKDKGKQQDFFVFSDAKSAQVFYDTKGAVIAISVDYLGSSTDAPPAEEVLGQTVQPKADGSMYALKRYPEAGYWVAYSRTAGKTPITTVTVQKM